MIDVVIDTCTLAHANNPESGYQDHSIELINKLFLNNTLITVDEGVGLDETSNRSYIGLEYLENLTPGMLGYSFLQFMANNQRFEFVSSKIPNSTKSYIEQIIRNKKDRMFLRVTLNSQEKTLISHDYEDYQESKRVRFRREIEISIVEAETINPQL
jgi:predicted nucleic acid-binding protein